MKKESIFSILSSALTILLGGVAGLLSLLGGYAVSLFLKRDEADYPMEAFRREKASPTVGQLVSKYGEPDDVIMVNATLGNEATGVILVYSAQKFFIINGNKVKNDEISSVTFNNTATPYVAGEYQIVVNTTLRDLPYLYMNAGPDASYAKDIMASIEKYLPQTR
ncbi:MAG: hypothetical protein IJ196_02295 [Prevotella sp.]|nr:hypothetical protein [Prevotella sp.]